MDYGYIFYIFLFFLYEFLSHGPLLRDTQAYSAYFFQVSGNTAFTQIFGYKRDEISGKWEKLQTA
jgi:hypothetical protein